MKQPKQSKGGVGLEAFRNRLRLRLPRSLFNGKQTYLSLGVDDTKLNRKIAEQKIRQIEADILSNNFDFTLATYKPQTHLASVAYLKPKQELKIPELWLEFQAFKQPNCAPGTWRTYVLQGNYLEKCPYKSLEDAQQVFDWIALNIQPIALNAY
jgi:integrase